MRKLLFFALLFVIVFANPTRQAIGDWYWEDDEWEWYEEDPGGVDEWDWEDWEDWDGTIPDFAYDGVNFDNDAFLDDVDNCPMVPSSSQDDLEGDGMGDVCDPDDEGDGIIDDVDNCPLDANADQDDLDGDDIGDVCDDDDDNDGVLGDSDVCLGTQPSEPVLANGCSIEQQCECNAPWKNHGDYVSCVAHASNALLNAEQITQAEKDAIMAAAEQSSCGKKK